MRSLNEILEEFSPEELKEIKEGADEVLLKIAKESPEKFFNPGKAYIVKDFRGFLEDPLKFFITLMEEKVLRYLGEGVFYLPVYSELLQKRVPLDGYTVMEAIGRDKGWTLQPSGNTILNGLGLSTQVPCNYTLLSDGPTITYKIGNLTLNFQNIPLAEAKLKTEESKLLVQAVKMLGKSASEEKYKDRFIQIFTKCKIREVLDEIQYVDEEIFNIIKSYLK